MQAGDRVVLECRRGQRGNRAPIPDVFRRDPASLTQSKQRTDRAVLEAKERQGKSLESCLLLVRIIPFQTCSERNGILNKPAQLPLEHLERCVSWRRALFEIRQLNVSLNHAVLFARPSESP